MILLIIGIITLVVGLFVGGLSVDYKLGAGIIVLGALLSIVGLVKPEWFEDYQKEHDKL
jgi:hypothetical protein